MSPLNFYTEFVPLIPTVDFTKIIQKQSFIQELLYYKDILEAV